MNIQPTPEQDIFIRQAIESGRISRPEDAVSEALSLWAARERRRTEILTAAHLSEDSFARGEGRTVTSLQEAKQLSDDVRRRGLARLTADQNSPR